MPPRRTRQLKSLKGRVQRLVTRSEYDKLLAKSSKRLVVVHYLTVRLWGIADMPAMQSRARSLPPAAS
jgi:hypothetical protein